MSKGWSTEYLGKWLFGQSDIWVPAHGDALYIPSLEKDYALNIILMLERNAKDCYEECATWRHRVHYQEDYNQWLRDSPLFKALAERCLSK